ncbi:flavodoxin [Collinsella tanakaei]|uniref:flavodoxin n=1 Tax=Collinsella tanakaei TaxID=626935 RepID=UPI001F2F7158|nr:flavodoxin [Collinsella tanakaei]MCF2621135.1 flavodoxin [Collinsella tanakaei]MDM8301456.1 flavodoxin [Collinsella tanakaei]
MSKIAVVFWSGTGNTEAMAQAVADGASAKNAEVDIVQASDFGADGVAGYDAIAFGCPAMGDEELEGDEFQPMWDDVKPELSGKTIALFGSYDWGTGEWMDTWKDDAEEAGASIAGTVIANNEPDDEAISACNDLGASLA